MERSLENLQSIEQFTPPEDEQAKSKQPAMEYGDLSPEEQEKMLELDRQFTTPQFIEIDAPELEGKKLRIEYIALDVRSDEEKSEAAKRNEHTIVHIPGYGSSYRSPEAFVKLLALREKKRVLLISQPSTGGSDMAPAEWRKWSHDKRTFAPFAETVSKSMDAIRAAESEAGNQLTTQELSVVSSSMGSIIAAEFAASHPEQVRDLILLHPGGVNEENAIGVQLFDKDEQGQKHLDIKFTGLGSRYFPETIGSKKETFRRKPMEDELIAGMEQAYREMFGKTLQQAYEEEGGKGTFSLQDIEQQETDMYQGVAKKIMKDSQKNLWRGKYYTEGFRWRLWEAFTIAKGGLLETLKNVKANVYVVSGTADKLFPASQNAQIKEALPNAANVESDILPTRHDEIYQRVRSYIERIGTFLDDMRKRESKEELRTSTTQA